MPESRHTRSVYGEAVYTLRNGIAPTIKTKNNTTPKTNIRTIRDTNMPCNHFNKPTYPVGTMTESGLKTTQPEEIEKYCTAFVLPYYPPIEIKTEYCRSDNFEKCPQYIKRHGKEPKFNHQQLQKND